MISSAIAGFSTRFFVRFLPLFFVGKAEEKETASAQMRESRISYVDRSVLEDYSFIPELTILLTKYL